MWAINNRHDTIAQILLDHGASVDVKTSSGRTALDFVIPHSPLYDYLASRGYVSSSLPDFYDSGHNPLDPQSIDMDDNMDDLTHRLMVESAFNLDVNMDHLRLDEDSDSDLAHNIDDPDNFVWDRCKPDQMFVFSEGDIPRILDLAITQMEPKRTKGQKPVPADILFLSSRYAHYYGSGETVDNLLLPACSRIRSLIMSKKDDISFLAFWLSNCTLLLYYLRKDPGLLQATIHHQRSIGQLITDISILITQDAERRLDIVLDSSILDHETIPGLDDIAYQSEWRLFKKSKKKNNKTHKEEMDELYGLSKLSAKMKPSPRNVTSILGSVLFVCDLYEIHPIIIQEILSQLFYWLGTVIFNRIMSNRKYLARSRAMQIRLNVSAIEDWSRQNNRQPEDVVSEFGDMKDVKKYPSLYQLCRKHFAPLVQLLQWLQIFTGFGDNSTKGDSNGSTPTTTVAAASSGDFSNVISTLQQLTALNPTQLLHVAKKYRAEVGEKGLSKEYKQYLAKLNLHYRNENSHSAKVVSSTIHNVMDAGTKKGNSNGLEEHEEAKKEKEKRKSIENEIPKIFERPSSNGAPTTEKSKEEAAKGKEKPAEEKVDEKVTEEKKEEKPVEEKATPKSVQETEELEEESDNANRFANSTAPIPPSPSVVSPTSLFLNDNEYEVSYDAGSGSAPLELYLDASAVLPFVVPTLAEMVFVWGYGLGGSRRSHNGKVHIPALPAEFLDRLEEAIGNSNLVNNKITSYDDEYGNGYDHANASDEDADIKMEEEIRRANINPVFGKLAVPERSAQKMWGNPDEEEEVDEFKSVW